MSRKWVNVWQEVPTRQRAEYLSDYAKKNNPHHGTKIRKGKDGTYSVWVRSSSE